MEGIRRIFLTQERLPVNIGNPNEFTVRELAELVIELTGSPSAIESLPLPADDLKVRQPDFTRVTAIHGWEPSLQLREGLAHRDGLASPGADGRNWRDPPHSFAEHADSGFRGAILSRSSGGYQCLRLHFGCPKVVGNGVPMQPKRLPRGRPRRRLCCTG